jgi:Lar family restriction alleviation protein
MIEQALLPCPFCGGVEHEIGYDSAGFDVQCHSWTCRAKTGSHTTEAEAIAAWNRRVVLDELDASKARGLRWRTFADEKPVAVSYLARFFDNEMGEWIFTVFDPGPLNITLAGPYTYWIPLNELLPPPPHGDAK